MEGGREGGREREGGGEEEREGGRGESDARWSHNSAGHGGNILHWTV